MIVTTVVLTNAAQAKCFHSQCRSRMYAVTHQILNLNCILSLEPNGDQWNFGKQHQQGPQNSYPISARGLEGFNTKDSNSFGMLGSTPGFGRLALLQLRQTDAGAFQERSSLTIQLARGGAETISPHGCGSKIG